MKVIYEPKGRAKEYSPLALNIYNGCVFGCAYCYVPIFTHKTKSDFHSHAEPRKDIVSKVMGDAMELEHKGEERQILLSFTSDPYPPVEKELEITRKVVDILNNYHLNFTVLTKNGKLAERDFDFIDNFGETITFASEEMRKRWEHNAPSIESRMQSMRTAHQMGIKTWVSLEPVIDPEEALMVVRKLADSVDVWKVGKLNHYPDYEKVIDWKKFYERLMAIFKELGVSEDSIYIKKDLLKEAKQ